MPAGQAAVVGRGVVDGRIFAGTVGKHGNETVIGTYVRGQGQEYEQLHVDHQLALF